MRIKKAVTAMSAVCQRATALTRGQKQPGRRYGPPPKDRGVPAVPQPRMGIGRREDIYRRQTGRRQVVIPDNLPRTFGPADYAALNGLTPRQRRRVWKSWEVTTA